MKVKTKKDRRYRIKLRLRKRVNGTAERPRLAVSRSLSNISVQLIDDQAGRTVASASSQEEKVRQCFEDGARGGNIAGAKVVGKMAAERLIDQGLKRIVFDRGGRLYHGRVRSVAEAAREAGLEF
tara:strand:+ start:24788 stop:25162 length:375 start_codon:yes stop_codon:yes gene_type:complete